MGQCHILMANFEQFNEPKVAHSRGVRFESPVNGLFCSKIHMTQSRALVVYQQVLPGQMCACVPIALVSACSFFFCVRLVPFTLVHIVSAVVTL